MEKLKKGDMINSTTNMYIIDEVEKYQYICTKISFYDNFYIISKEKLSFSYFNDFEIFHKMNDIYFRRFIKLIFDKDYFKD